MLCVLIRIIQLLCRRSIDFPELAIFAFRPGAMINLHWLELPMARTIFHGSNGVRTIDVRLYKAILTFLQKSSNKYYHLNLLDTLPVADAIY